LWHQKRCRKLEGGKFEFGGSINWRFVLFSKRFDPLQKTGKNLQVTKHFTPISFQPAFSLSFSNETSRHLTFNAIENSVYCPIA